MKLQRFLLILCLCVFAALSTESAFAQNPKAESTPAPMPAATPVPPAPSQTLNFKQTIEYAVENSPSLKVYKLELAARELEYKNARSVFFPMLDLSTSAGLRETNPTTNPSNRVSTLDLNLSETLYDNGVSFTRYNTAQLQRDIAKLSYENERDQLALSVGQEFLRYSLSANLVDVQEQQFDIINKQYSTVSGLYRQGIRTRKDYLRFKTELRRAEIDFLQAKNSLSRSRVELNRLLGVEIRETVPNFAFTALPLQFNIVENLPARAPNIDDHFRYRIASLQRRVYQNDVKLVRREYWPQLA
ncbi:MAG: hypothetical protein EOP05_13590, partial [Proteobacteria bacterium]